ncbi:hypothetical protein [Bacillus pseudomycoides]|uniref:Amino acid permease n=1 Tax=Bacillus pseudomycoides TaxID=64104 RepID=A0ABD6TBV5_9BACI|nr:hypothetical protein [Bacillus pseudomycoides]PEP85151.1 hypothetical protein CN584_12940 [Bacillus pseudomycoides]PHE94043.1 hypothetical protein COF81_17220 [Bacillus pseudomycoides]
MRIVKDERLMIQGLKHTRMTFVLQNLVILGMVFYRYVIKGVGYEGGEPVKRSYFFKLLLLPITLAIVIMGINMIVTPNASLKGTGLIGLVIFICFLVPSLYAYNYRRTIRSEEDE